MLDLFVTVNFSLFLNFKLAFKPMLINHRKRDRHAKTLDIAQEEVLTCLGIHIFERLHRIWQKLRSEEQTWLILFYMGVDALRKSYQVSP